jgi:hypothetical protein
VSEQRVPLPGKLPQDGDGTLPALARMMTGRLTPRRVSPGVSAGVWAGVYRTPAETPARGRQTPQVSGEIDLGGADPAHG